MHIYIYIYIYNTHTHTRVSCMRVRRTLCVSMYYTSTHVYTHWKHRTLAQSHNRTRNTCGYRITKMNGGFVSEDIAV